MSRQGERCSCELDDVLAEVDLVACPGPGRLQRRAELLLVRKLADNAETPVGAVDPVRMAAVRARPVDEEVGQLARRRRGGWLGRAELEQSAPELLDPRPGGAGEREGAEDARIRVPRTAGRRCL